MKFKKALALGMITLAGATVLTTVASCGAVDNRLHIRLATTAGQANIKSINRMVESFEKENPDYAIDVDKVGGNYNDIAKITKDGFGTDNYADMVMVYPDAVADFIDYLKAYQLDPYINEYFTPEELAEFVPVFLEEGQKYTSEGTYSLPFSKSGEVVYYDKDTIIGLKLGDNVFDGKALTAEYFEDITWEEFMGNFCPAVVEYNNKLPESEKIIQTKDDDWAVMSYDSDANLFITLAAQYEIPYTSVDTSKGKGSADFNNKDMIDLMETWHGYAQKNYINTQAGTKKHSNEFLANDKCLFSVGSTAGASYQLQKNPENLGVFMVPHAEGHAKKTLLQGPSMAFLQHVKNGQIDEERKEVSMKFYKHCVSYDNAMDWATTANYFPVLTAMYDDPAYIELYDEEQYTDKTSLDALTCRIATIAKDLKNYYFTSPAFKGSQACRNEVQALTGELLSKTQNGKNLSRAQIEDRFEEAYDNSTREIF